MRTLLIVAVAAMASNSALALTQVEIKAAVSSVSTPSELKEYKDCLRFNGGKFVQKTEVKDLNGDGVDEIILTETGTKGAAVCFGMIGQIASILIADGSGKWRRELGFRGELSFIKRSDSAWPDVEIGGPGFCFPLWRMRDSGHYTLYKQCDENNRLVDFKDEPVSTATQASAPKAEIGKQVPVEVIKSGLEGPPYDHNGSIVIVDAEKGVIVYDRPKRSIASTIIPGTVLFRGAPWKEGDQDIVIKGTAYVFKAGCPAAAYDVRGTYHSMYGISKLTFEGSAPVRSKTSCDIVGHTTTGANSKLVFDIAIE
ncbi:MAG TPA: hypothetical protein VGO06_00625 [Bosea sp. (in: a-proteobacteria)]|jgi:hypothetical protein|uniref:hypothetical protein n=1 Tax=Bosea sp. (in: a-proteobacteria) TaxID=1871050 RepID=UPI002E13DB04|nr:hypothetical protein [Bosea sp. (in: a-proteobacteria)]